MRFKVANYSRLEIRLDTLHIYTRAVHNLSTESELSVRFVLDQQAVMIIQTGNHVEIWSFALERLSLMAFRVQLQFLLRPISGARVAEEVKRHRPSVILGLLLFSDVQDTIFKIVFYFENKK